MSDSILELLLNQTCVYWPKGAVNSFGIYTHGTPVELPCKWKSAKGESVTKEGKVHSITVEVYLRNEVALDGWLWKGKLADAPSVPPNTQIIRNVDVTDDVENDETLWVASL